MKQMTLIVDQQAESQLSQIPEIPTGETWCQILVRRQLVMSLLVVAQRAMREQLLIKKYRLLVPNAEGYEERMEYDTQTDQGDPDEIAFTIAQDEQ
ncbi:hypothetical protein F511_10042 [Dorcoceras hygrometricum]|uniref:Uncharacterized protein n=1 Tax=Dorcoceras hygrometricum TaxID=472368 RepID=A0A2Z7AC11_9LAMI|nr:hypothetical protein F511_10042 [Dorcoceras hygrometricum]